MTDLAVDVVKRRGKRPTEKFDDNKLYCSVVSACLSVRAPIGHAEKSAREVCKVIAVWCSDKPEITSHDLRDKTAEALKQFHPDASYLYKHHKDIL